MFRKRDANRLYSINLELNALISEVAQIRNIQNRLNNIIEQNEKEKKIQTSFQDNMFVQRYTSDFKIIFENERETKIFVLGNIHSESVLYEHGRTTIRLEEALDQTAVVKYWQENGDSVVTIIKEMCMVNVATAEEEFVSLKFENIKIIEIEFNNYGDACTFLLRFEKEN